MHIAEGCTRSLCRLAAHCERWMSAETEFHFEHIVRPKKLSHLVRCASTPRVLQKSWYRPLSLCSLCKPSTLSIDMRDTWTYAQNWIYGFLCRRHITRKLAHTSTGPVNDIYERPVATERWKLNANDESANERTGNGSLLAHTQFYLYTQDFRDAHVEWVSSACRSVYVVRKMQENVKRHVGAKWPLSLLAVCALRK